STGRYHHGNGRAPRLGPVLGVSWRAVIGGLLDAWEALAGDVWLPLADYEADKQAVPDDIFIALFLTVADYLSPTPSNSELEIVRSDIATAKDRFLGIKGTDFPTEGAAADFIVEASRKISEYDIDGFVDHFAWLVDRAMRKFNLPYSVQAPFTLRVL